MQPECDAPVSGIEITAVVQVPSSYWRQHMCEPAGLPHSVDLLHSGTLFSRTFPEPEACGSSDYTIEI